MRFKTAVSSVFLFASFTVLSFVWVQQTFLLQTAQTGTQSSAAIAAISGSYQGYFDGLQTDSTPYIYGWALDNQHYEQNVVLEISYGATSDYSKATVFTTVTANQPSGDVLKATGVTGAHRFKADIPAQFSAQTHYWFAAIVTSDGRRIQLNHSPLQLKMPQISAASLATASTSQSVTTLYRMFLARAPEPTGLDSWSKRVAAQSTATDVMWQIFTSTESLKRNMKVASGSVASVPDDAFVDALCMTILRRSCDASGKSGYVHQLQNGAARRTIFDSFVFSKESRSTNAGLFATGVLDKGVVSIPQSTQCILDGVTVASGQSRVFFKSAAVIGTTESDTNCSLQSASRFCRAGVLDGDGAYARATCTETLMNYRESLLPTTSQKQIGFFKDTNKSPNSGRVLTYWIENGALKTSFDYVFTAADSASAKNQLFYSVPFSVGNWAGNPSLIDSASRVYGDATKVGVSVPGPSGAAALTIEANKDFVQLHARSHEQMAAELGGVFFPKSYGSTDSLHEAKTNMITSSGFQELKYIRDYSSLRLTFDAELKNADVVTSRVSGTPNGSRAQTTYDSNKHATQFILSLGAIQWRDARCASRIETDPVCKYFGKYSYIILHPFDERFEFYPAGYQEDIYTHNSIRHLDVRNFLSGSPSKNPFKIVGNRVKAEGDILPYIKESILRESARGNLPPRLSVNGHTETDDEYFAHFNFGPLNIGYEITGLADMTYNIYDFTLTGVRKSAVAPSCVITVTPKVVTKGQSVTVSWKSISGDSLFIQGVGSNLPAVGSRTLTPAATTVLWGKISGKQGTNDCNDIVIVK